MVGKSFPTKDSPEIVVNDGDGNLPMVEKGNDYTFKQNPKLFISCGVKVFIDLRTTNCEVSSVRPFVKGSLSVNSLLRDRPRGMN